MSRPKDFTSALVPLAAATAPEALSAALAASRMATMLASVSAGAAGVMAGVDVAATADESVTRALSAVLSLLAQAATSAAAQARANGVRRITLCIGPPNGVLTGHHEIERRAKRKKHASDECPYGSARPCLLGRFDPSCRT